MCTSRSIRRQSTRYRRQRLPSHSRPRVKHPGMYLDPLVGLVPKGARTKQKYYSEARSRSRALHDSRHLRTLFENLIAILRLSVFTHGHSSQRFE